MENYVQPREPWDPEPWRPLLAEARAAFLQDSGYAVKIAEAWRASLGKYRREKPEEQPREAPQRPQEAPVRQRTEPAAPKTFPVVTRAMTPEERKPLPATPGKEPKRHGTIHSYYKLGCRCEICTEFTRNYWRERRNKKKQQQESQES